LVNTNHNVREISAVSALNDTPEAGIMRTWLIDEFGLDSQYLLEGEKRSLLIDTGTGVADLRTLVEKLTDKPYDVVATHGHNDHTGGCVQFPCLFIHPDDIMMVNPSLENKREYASKIFKTYNSVGGKMPFSLSDITDGPLPEFIPIRAGYTFDLGNRVIETLETPGHTAGSIAFLDRKNHLLFSGDAFNPIFLLWIETQYPADAAEIFLSHAKQIVAMRDAGDFKTMYGGHCDKFPIDPQVLSDLIDCAEGIIDGSITPRCKRIHIFHANFYSLGLADILIDRDL
jgi:glyoxylase-like metal-dependent hydrolase (beta-lactamase superfamily II)